MTKFSVIVLPLFLASCPPNPTPSPSPSPTPTPSPVAQLLIRQLNPPALVRDNKPFTPFGAIQCCMEYNPKILNSKNKPAPRKPKPLKLRGVKATCNTLWPLASECWMDYLSSKNANFYHFRMGPFYGDIDHESEWAGIGGPYLGGPGSEFNPKFWDKYRDLLAHAQKLNSNVEVNVIDTWYCKHAQWGDQEMPWPKEDIEACGRSSSQEQERYIRKVVSEGKEFSNIIWITDNEGDQITGDDCRWFEWVRTIIREEEFNSGGAVRMVGTNNIRCGSGPFDYVATHQRAALTTPLYSKHTENNERNPAFSPEQEYSNFCTAQRNGLHYWFWRAEMSDSDFERTLELFSQGCNVPQECFAPDADDPLWGSNITGAGIMKSQVENAKSIVGERCNSVPPHEGAFPTLSALAAQLRKSGYCASGPWGDALVVYNGEKWEEYHSVRYTDGCWSVDPTVNPKFLWTYNGTNPTDTCDIEVPATDEIFCKILQPGQGLWDCTPKAKGQPILPEGHPKRFACELKSMGGYPVYSLSSSSLALTLVPNPLQFKITGSGSGLVTCKIPSNTSTLCNTQVSR